MSSRVRRRLKAHLWQQWNTEAVATGHRESWTFVMDWRLSWQAVAGVHGESAHHRRFAKHARVLSSLNLGRCSKLQTL